MIQRLCLEWSFWRDVAHLSSVSVAETHPTQNYPSQAIFLYPAPSRLPFLHPIRGWHTKGGHGSVGLTKLLQGKFSQLHWWMLAFTAGLCLAVALFVDLKPQVEGNFFFSSNDAAFKESARIDSIFPSGSQLIVSVAAPRISSAQYLKRLAALTEALEAVPSVTSAESLTEGPKDFEDAEKSPLWKRLLIAEDGRSSNVVLFVSSQESKQLISRIETITSKFDDKDFHIQVAGAPYVAEMIRRSLQHDFLTFSVASVLLFGIGCWILFRSAKLTLGMLCTCTSAVLLTLLVQSWFGQKIGILTANLGTIVFVVALSHLVYMTFNWQTLVTEGKEGKVEPDMLSAKAWRTTLPASSWSMFCAALGFGSLLFVPAKPLRELGWGGVLGTVVAFGCAYLMYPSFLRWAGEPHNKKRAATTDGASFWQGRFVWVSIAAVGLGAGMSLGLTRLNTDPSLLDYFKKGIEPREGLAYIDRNGGSNPFTMVVAAADGTKLDTKEEYQKMWDLQDALQAHKEVGTVISLPLLMGEADRHALAFLLTWNHLLNILNEPKHARVASSFVTKDRKLAAFYLRMNEQRRTKPRLQVVGELRKVAAAQGFRVALVGGVYDLQGELAKMVARSLVSGLLWLLLFFTVVALIVARSFRVAAAMIFSLSLVPICILGGIGLLNIPVDIISAPATNVCIGMAIDSMVHLIFAMRRARREGQEGWRAWVVGRQEQWRGIVYSDVIIAAGFGIFALSNFPPTQRFGLVVLAGTVVDILANLFLLPLLGGANWNGLLKAKRA